MIPPLILQPKPDDPHRAEDILNDIQAVVTKHRCALVVQNGGAYLCVTTGQGDLRAIAEVSVITPQGMQWRPYIWNEPGKPV